MEPVRDIIFVVDDDMTILAITKKMLETQYEVFTMPSGNKLFSLLEKITPSLIFLDVEMPEMNGFEVIKNLKNSDKNASIPVIFLSGTESSERAAKCLELGAVDFLKKPCPKNTLLEKSAEHIKRG